MIKNLFFFALLVLAVVVGYMYFFGKGEDREAARSVVSETRELGRSVADFLKRQKEKYDDGEFDALLDKISNTVNKIKSRKEEPTAAEKDELRDLENELRQIDPDKLSEEDKERLKKLLDEMHEETR